MDKLKALILSLIIIGGSLLVGNRALKNSNPSVKPFVLIQPCVSTVDEEMIRFIGDAAHNRGLKLTWYVPPNPDSGINDGVIALFKSYAQLGDSIQLSFRGVFFNWMPPDQRASYVDMTFNNFRNIFGTYPTTVFAFYIDAYTINYMVTKYPSVKGGIVFCNHEVACDYLESKGGYHMPYYPSKYNTMVPTGGSEKMDFVAFPFLHRDLTNNIRHQEAIRDLYPGDYLLTVQRVGEGALPPHNIYFDRLFQAYAKGWTPFGLVLYGLDVPHNLAEVKDLITEDFNYIQDKVTKGEAVNVLDVEFINWFKGTFRDSPSYTWKYADPEGSGQAFEWRFSTENRKGYIDGQLLEARTYLHNTYEPVYSQAISQYQNNMPLAS